MKASLDTDIVIHLHKSDKESLLFLFCDKLFIHEYLLEKELKRKSYSIYENLIKDKNIEIVYNSDLIKMNIKRLFEDYLEKYKYLFDDGELYAVALAKAMGLTTFFSDDTKEFGPHDTLVRELIEDIIPFAFYELLLFKYLETNLKPEDLYKEFEEVSLNSMSKHPMNFRNRMLVTVRRFSNRYGTERDKKWIKEFCDSRNINYRNKMRELKALLNSL